MRAASTAAFFALSTPTQATGTPGGICTTERIASRPPIADRRLDSGTPVLVLTARTDEADVLRAFERGADDYLRKPFALSELIAEQPCAPQRDPGVRDAHDQRGVLVSREEHA